MPKVRKVVGTNCYNCSFILSKSDPVISTELNDQGGIDPKTEEEMERAKRADLITLPGGSRKDATDKRFCSNTKIEMFVTVRMCCGYWDSEGVKRPWKK